MKGYSERSQMEINKKITVYIFAAILYFTPFFRGLFFQEGIYTTGLVLAGLFLWYAWFNKEDIKNDFIRWEIIDIGLIGLLLAYFISTFTAVIILDAVDMSLRIAIYLMVYIISVGLSKSLNNTKNLLAVMYTSGVIVALVGIAAYAGVDIKDAVLHGRISSTFQYPNALGAYLAAIGLIGTYLLVTSDIQFLKNVLTAGNIIIFTALFGTSSRGTFLALVPAYLIFAGFQPSKYRAKTFGTICLNFLFGGTAAYLIANKAGNLMIWAYIALLGVLGVVINFVFHGQMIKLNRRVSRILLLVMVLAVIAFGFSISENAGLLNRISQISLKDRNVVERAYFYSDAFKIIKDYPLFGVGGGGWVSIYKAYQSYGYTSTQVHNHYLQTWVEAGILGISSIIFVILGVLKLSIKILREGSETDKLLVLTLLCSSLVIAVQSAIDFTMSYGAIGILVWVLFGMLRSSGHMQDLDTKKSLISNSKDCKLILAFGASISLIVAVFCSSLLLSIDYEKKSIETLKKREYDKRTEYLKKMQIFNPFYADTYSNLSIMERKMFNVDNKKEHLRKALDYSTKAVNRNKGNINIRLEKINVLFALKDMDNAVKETETAFELAPWDQESYNLLAYAYLSAGKHYLKSGDRQKGIDYLNKAMRVPKLLSSRMKQLTKEEMNIWVGKKPTFDKKLQKYVGQAALLINKET